MYSWSVYQSYSTSRGKKFKMRTWWRAVKAKVSEPLNKAGSHSNKNLNLIQQELGSHSKLNQSRLTSGIHRAPSMTKWKKTGNPTLIAASKELSSAVCSCLCSFLVVHLTLHLALCLTGLGPSLLLQSHNRASATQGPWRNTVLNHTQRPSGRHLSFLMP